MCKGCHTMSSTVPSNPPTGELPPPAAHTSVLCSIQALRDSWYAVARSDQVTAAPHGVTLLGTSAVLYRAPDGTVVAAPDRCPHRQSPLSVGWISTGSGCLVCPYHGWEFGDHGRCTKVPSATDGVPPPPRAHLATFPTTERYGLVWLSVGQPSGDVPVVPHEDDPAFRRLNTPVDVWTVSATRMTDNFLDITHFPFVHTGTFGIAQDTHVPKLSLEPLDDGWFGYRYSVRARNDEFANAASGQTTDVVERRMTSGFHLPFSVRSTIEYHTGLQHILLLLSTPIDDVTSYFTFVVWRNDDHSVPADEILAFDLAIGAEDKRMLSRVPGVLPLDQTTVVSVQADKCSVEWRRRLIEMINA